MKLADLFTKPKRIMGADCSTKSFAYSVFDDGKLVQWGEIFFDGKNVFERIIDAHKKITALKDELNIETLYIEAAIYVNNKSTVVSMAYAVGAISTALEVSDIVQVTPLEWQSYIGNKVLNKAEKDAIKKANPGKSSTWYTNANREHRKDRTRQWVKSEFGLEIESDNVCDAIGLGYFGLK